MASKRAARFPIMLVLHDPRCADYSQRGHPERPSRVTRTAAFLRQTHPSLQWDVAKPAERSELLRAHSDEHLAKIEIASGDFDADTPAYSGIFEHAARASGAAICAARTARYGQPALSLMRPPGHHATRDRAMGFCYFNHVAVAALDALANGAERVAIWDFDAHHGNGTEEIVCGHAQIRFASVHQFPAYPGTGARSFDNIINLPVPSLTPRADHMRVLRDSLDSLVAFAPGLLLVSAGFDAYAGDPITQMSLEQHDFRTLGEWLRATNLPAAAILEGGYSDDLPQLVGAFLSGWNAG